MLQACHIQQQLQRHFAGIAAYQVVAYLAAASFLVSSFVTVASCLVTVASFLAAATASYQAASSTVAASCLAVQGQSLLAILAILDSSSVARLPF